VQSDLRKGGAELLAKTALEKFNGIDVLVCCAGIAPTRDGLASTVDSEFCETFDVNVLGVVRACRAAVPHMATKAKGRLSPSLRISGGCRNRCFTTTACRNPQC